MKPLKPAQNRADSQVHRRISNKSKPSPLGLVPAENGELSAAAERAPRKYQVFISSTFKDLKTHRARATYAVVSCGHMATCLETWGMKNDTQLRVIKQAVSDCQFYVVILGHCYGSIPKGKKEEFHRDGVGLRGKAIRGAAFQTNSILRTGS